MTPQAYIFMGPSGSGKGTQVQLFKDVLLKLSPETKVLHIDTGLGFRKLTSEGTYTIGHIKELLNAGGLQSEALAIHIWASKMIYEAEKDQHFVMDGSPRTILEARVLETMFKFYSFEKPMVIMIDVSPEEVKKRLLLRKRPDDTDAGIERRIGWYQKQVLPTVDFYRTNDKYSFVQVNGEQSVEDVHKEILSKTGLA